MPGGLALRPLGWRAQFLKKGLQWLQYSHWHETGDWELGTKEGGSFYHPPADTTGVGVGMCVCGVCGGRR
jgi:hypothetical protein